MAIFKRGDVYWFNFWWNGQHVQRSTRQGNPRVARQMEAAYRTRLAKGEAGIVERKPAPTLEGFAQRFVSYVEVRSAAKPNTVAFYAKKLARLLLFEPLATASLDKIDEALIENFVQYRSKQVSPASVNRELATLRRLLRMAHEWKVISRVPRIRLLPGERIREFVLSREQEHVYLGAAPQPLRDVAILVVDTGLRAGEALALEWRDVHLEPANGGRFGYLQVRDGKSKNARRKLCLTGRVRGMLQERLARAKAPWVFTAEDGTKPLSVYTIDDQHARLRKLLQLAKDFVIHSLRHTFGTRLGECGADAFTIMRILGHSTVAVSQRYVHPSGQAIEGAFERLETLLEGQKVIEATTIPTTRQLAARTPAV